MSLLSARVIKVQMDRERRLVISRGQWRQLRQYQGAARKRIHDLDAARLFDGDVGDAPILLNYKSQVRPSGGTDLAVPIRLDQGRHRRQVIRTAEVRHFEVAAAAAAPR